MAKKVLGDDPFEAGKSAPPAPGAKKSRPAPASKSSAPRRASRKPPAPAAEPAPAEQLAAAPPAEPTEASVPAPAPVAPVAAQERVVDEPDEAPLPAPARIPLSLAVRVDPAPMDDADDAAEADAPPQSAVLEAFVPTIPPPALEGPLDARIRDVEAQLDALLAETRGRDGQSDERVTQLRERLAGSIPPPAPSASREGAPNPTVADSDADVVAQELARSDYFVRQWGRSALRDRTEQVEEFGLDPAFAARSQATLDFLYERWWRVEVAGLDHVPGEGGVILCANHSGALPWDGVMLATALRREHPARRELRWLAEDFVCHTPFVGNWLQKLGAVRACQENAERLLSRKACVGVFPEGVKGVSKPYRDRYKLQRFGRGGHVKLALRTRTPIVPVSIVGAEETHPMLSPMAPLARLLGLPYVPVTPTFPLLGPLGLLPLPSKWKIEFLEPLALDAYGPGADEDEVLVGRLNEKLRATLQESVDRAVRSRRSVLRG